MAAVRLSSPGLATPQARGPRLRPFLASQESLAAAILRCAPALRVRRRSPAADDRHRGRDGRGLEQPRRSEMATIGSFKKSSSNEFQGEIVTLSVQAKGVRIVPETSRTSDNAPSHRILVGRAEIGAAWSKRSNEGRNYLSVKLDDPSFTAPIFANLFDEDGETFTLIWSRGRKANGERSEEHTSELQSQSNLVCRLLLEQKK